MHRRFAPLYPGAPPVCANGCHDYPQTQVMPAAYPSRPGWLGTCCVSCGWTCLYHLRHGDRPEDVYWITDEDVPAARAAQLRAWSLHALRRHGYPDPAWAPDGQRQGCDTDGRQRQGEEDEQ